MIIQLILLKRYSHYWQAVQSA